MPSGTRPGTKPQRAHRQVTDRLLPQTRDNWRRLERVPECQRQLYNAALQERSDAWRPAGVSLTLQDRFRSLTVCRREIPEMAAVPVAIQRSTPSPDGTPVSAVLKREAGRWSAVVCHAVAHPEPEDDGTAIGIDMNAGQVAASDGRLFHAPDMRRLEARKRRYQRMVARLARTARRIAMTRRDWHHRVSRRIAENAHTVAIEKLKVKAMTARARGTVKEPGFCVRRKAGLNRVVLDTGWAALRAMLEYKAGCVIAVDPRHTSQTCAACGHVDARSRRTRDRFHCVACGHAGHADANANAAGLHPDKTRLVEFGRFANADRRRRGEGKPETFDFPGFTHFCATTRQGRFRPGRKPVAKRVNRTLARIGEVLRKRRHHDIREVGAWLGRVCQGWFNDDAVPGSGRWLIGFRRRLQRLWMRELRRRSQRDRLNWKRLERMTATRGRTSGSPSITRGRSRMVYRPRPDLCGGVRSKCASLPRPRGGCRGAGPWNRENREHTSTDDGMSRHAFLVVPFSTIAAARVRVRRCSTGQGGA